MLTGKTCCTCKRALPLTEFNRRAAATDGLQSRCRDCSRAWYLANSTQHIANVGRRNKVARAALQVRLREYLLTHPCVDCGESDLRCLEFDHIDPSTKAADISILTRRVVSWQTMASEIAKCVVRCANCHRRRTSDMVGSWRSAPRPEESTDPAGP